VVLLCGACSLDPNTARQRYFGSNQYMKAGKDPEATLATESLSRALARQPDFDGAQQAKEPLSSLRPR
jgi:hypothetical protein